MKCIMNDGKHLVDHISYWKANCFHVVCSCGESVGLATWSLKDDVELKDWLIPDWDLVCDIGKMVEELHIKSVVAVHEYWEEHLRS